MYELEFSVPQQELCRELVGMPACTVPIRWTMGGSVVLHRQPAESKGSQAGPVRARCSSLV